MQNKSESGRTMLETLAVIAIIILLGIFAICWFKGALARQEADRDYEDIMTTITSLYNRGTRRTNKGIADTLLTYNKTRSGKPLSISYNCPQDTTAIVIKIDDIDERTCRYLMEKDWGSSYKPLFFLRGEMEQNVCTWNGDKAGLYHLTGPSDCTKVGAPEKGSLTVVFSDMKRPSQCTTHEDCKTSCGTCDEETHRCVGECLSACTAEVGCGENECVRCDDETKTCRNLCIPVEYLESTGTQWIDTGVIGHKYSTIENSVYLIGKRNNSCAVGSWGENKRTERAWLSYFFGNDFRIGWGDNNNSNRVEVLLDTWYDWKTEILNNKQLQYINGEKIYTSGATAEFTTNQNLYLFGMNSGGIFDYGFRGRMGYVKLYDNNVLVRDFVPVLDTDGVPAMFDRVEKKLYYNQGTGTFKTNLSN